MSIINSIKTFFIKTAGTPVPPVNFSSSVSKDCGESISKTSTNSFSKHTRSEKILRYFWKIIRFISKLFTGAITLVVLANFAPELREELPSLYRFVDLLLVWLEWIFAQFWQVVEKVF